MKWIKCSEQMPKNNHWVLVGYFEKGKFISFPAQFIKGIKKKNGWWNGIFNEGQRDKIEYWLLPEPPKE